jgi:hypothetical protein
MPLARASGRARRAQIRMSDGDLRDFLAEQMIVNIATVQPERASAPRRALVRADGVELTRRTYATCSSCSGRKPRCRGAAPRATARRSLG